MEIDKLDSRFATMSSFNVVGLFNIITYLLQEKTAYLIPNAIQITTKNKKTYFFATFHNRDSTYDIINK